MKRIQRHDVDDADVVYDEAYDDFDPAAVAGMTINVVTVTLMIHFGVGLNKH